MPRLRFGQFEFDPDRGLLTKNGQPVKLQPQPALVLARLASRAGDLVSRDELQRALWPDGTHVDFERSLNFAIAQVRSALGDAAESPRFVETVPKRGYRFIAPVSDAAPAGSPSATAPPAPGAPAQPARWTRRAAAIAAITLLAVAGIAALAAMSGDDRARIAVFAFDNETEDGAYERIAGGIADETIARLSTPERLARIDVIGNAAVLREPRTFRDLRKVGRDLGARYVILAQLKRDERGVRLIAHLIRVSDQAHIWAETFDRADFSLQAQTEIAEAIAASVAAQF